MKEFKSPSSGGVLPKVLITTMGIGELKFRELASSRRKPCEVVGPGSFPNLKTRARITVEAVAEVKLMGVV
jgi:hypothetical protein